MDKRLLTSRILAITGTVLVWLPILAPLVFSIAAAFTRGRFIFDYLMPAEILPLFLIGGALLIWASLRARLWQKYLLWSYILALVALIISQVLAIVSGLAAGRVEPKGTWFILTIALLIIYELGIIVTGVGGILLIRDLFKIKPEKVQAENPSK